MRNLPVSVSEQEIEEMFAIADTDRDDKISYEVNPLSIALFKIFQDRRKRSIVPDRYSTF